jgi:hypothetical protein
MLKTRNKFSEKIINITFLVKLEKSPNDNYKMYSLFIKREDIIVDKIQVFSRL